HKWIDPSASDARTTIHGVRWCKTCFITDTSTPPGINRQGCSNPGQEKFGLGGISATLRSCQRGGIHHVDRASFGVRQDLIEYIGKLDLVLVSRDIADVRSDDHVVHSEEWVVRI